MFKDYRLNQKPTYNFIEIIQHRVSADGTKVVLARNKRPMSRWFYNPWDVNSPLSVKKPTYYTDNCYYVSPAVTLSLSVLPILKRNGFRGNTHGLTPTDCISNLMNSNKHETLFKARQYSAFKYFSVKTIENYWASLKIAMRNHYIIKDASTWRDLIDALQVCGIDTHNPKFVCPKNMKEAHDFWVKRAERIKERLRLQHRIEQAKQQEQSFIEAKSRFFGIRISSKDICIHVLSSIEEYLQEGKEMHHCVFTNEYFSKADSLILSATDRENNRLATIELSLETFKILQCRAAFNEIPPKKAEIDQLLMSNIGLFKRASA